MDLATLSLTELRRLQSKVETEIRRRSDNTRRELIKKMQKMAADEGLSLSDLIGSAPASEDKRSPGKRKAKPAAKKTSPIPAKYRHPENPAISWSGRGRKPHWVVDWLAQDKPLVELEIAAEK
ncbi:H-NS family nucleoid-associated regulatory protein [Aromatoleum anaerobium]|uniref:H-NS histone family protein n=1 Tax=Aromatoleum anaerobium TaxID=182180 RepID=A0ABX1PN88_9RHOO|nr:H-NS histone family protein [Aromatoleum anaerobium]MCK0505496.1 H-NS histone family protein [Aromatoleum anaerobium]